MARYLVRNAESERRYSFLDGPITANNPMGVHHAWGRTYKDLFQRYHTMLGERQRYQNGFDCQGLWIEVEVEKELGFNNKRQIESFGIDRFVELCKARVDRFAALISRAEPSASATGWTGTTATTRTPTRTTTRSGRSWPSATGSGLLYRGHDVMTWCPRCGTGISNMERGRGLPRGEAPVADAAPAGHHRRPRGRGPAGVDDDAVDAVEQRRRRGPPRADLPARRGSRGTPVVGERRIEGAGGRDAPVIREARGRRAGRPHLHRPVRRAAGRRPGSRIGSSRGTEVRRRRGDRHRPHRPGMRAGGLRARPSLRAARSSTRSTSSASSATASAGRPAASRARRTTRRRTSRATSPPTSSARDSSWRPSSTPTTTRTAGAAGRSSIFRLVDEWFIAMDPLREPVSRSTRRGHAGCRRGIGLEERELDWLRNMSDWMISKKRYYGLALPIWECTECDGVGGHRLEGGAP